MSKPGYVVYTKDFANMVCRRLERENKKKDKEIERLNNIINEVREEIRILETNCDIADYQAQKLFQILDKVGSDKE